ncbi:MAG: hypothetical protein JWM28_3489 [Chitinophagaceae bacterium]|nr:hypothetical protein [Chitinophagaceae bacterium]
MRNFKEAVFKKAASSIQYSLSGQKPLNLLKTHFMKQNISLFLCSLVLLISVASCKTSDNRSQSKDAPAKLTAIMGTAPDGHSKAKADSTPVKQGQWSYNPQGDDVYPLLYILSSILIALLFIRTLKVNKHPTHYS